jgi:hypothetical protein
LKTTISDRKLPECDEEAGFAFPSILIRLQENAAEK